MEFTTADSLAIGILTVTQAWTVFTLTRMNESIMRNSDKLDRHIERVHTNE